MRKHNVSKKLVRLNEKIKAQNEAFKKMSKAQKRVAIAQDVIASLKAKRYTAETGTYCEMNLKSNVDIPLEGGCQSVELQDLILGGAVESCNVCAIGSIFTSKVALGNKFKVELEDYGDGDVGLNDDLSDDSILIASLRGIFNETELRKIEYAFEGKDIAETFYDKPESFHDKYVEFHGKYPTDEKRLVAIMKNIIQNEGNFKI